VIAALRLSMVVPKGILTSEFPCTSPIVEVRDVLLLKAAGTI